MSSGADYKTYLMVQRKLREEDAAWQLREYLDYKCVSLGFFSKDVAEQIYEQANLAELTDWFEDVIEQECGDISENAAWEQVIEQYIDDWCFDNDINLY